MFKLSAVYAEILNSAACSLFLNQRSTVLTVHYKSTEDRFNVYYMRVIKSQLKFKNSVD